MTSHYDTLGVSKNATQTEIKKAYAKLSLAEHPDKKQGEEAKKIATEKIAKINAAYDILKDEEKRSHYDMFGDDGPGMHMGSGMTGDNIFDFINRSMNGSMNGSQQRKRKPVVQIQVDVTLEDCYNNNTIKHAIHRADPCTVCDATGFANKQVKRCDVCKGKKVIFAKQQTGPHSSVIVQRPCNSCQATGKSMGNCNSCTGKGVIKGEHTLTIQVKADTITNSTTVIPNEGPYVVDDDDNKNCRADVIIIFNVLPHDTFIRDRDDLVMELKLSPFELIFGFKSTIKQLDGRLLTVVNNDTIFNNGDRITIKNEGFQGKYGLGSLIVVLTANGDAIKLTQEQREKGYELFTGKNYSELDFSIPDDSCLVNYEKCTQTFNDNDDNNRSGYYDNGDDDDDDGPKQAQCVHQ